MDSLKLAQLLCSRLCHDLITPVGAISTGLEIIEETLADPSADPVDAELMSLTSMSAKNAAKRLVYYRAAFGYSAISSCDSPGKIEQLLRPFLQSHKVNLKFEHDLAHEEETEIREYTRLIINLVGVLTETAPHGGTMTITIKKTTEKQPINFGIDIKLEGDLVALKPDNTSALMGTLSEDNVNPHNVQSYLCSMFLDMKDVTLEFIESQPSCIHLSLMTGRAQQSLVGSLF